MTLSMSTGFTSASSLGGNAMTTTAPRNSALLITLPNLSILSSSFTSTGRGSKATSVGVFSFVVRGPNAEPDLLPSSSISSPSNRLILACASSRVSPSAGMRSSSSSSESEESEEEEEEEAFESARSRFCTAVESVPASSTSGLAPSGAALVATPVVPGASSASTIASSGAGGAVGAEELCSSVPRAASAAARRPAPSTCIVPSSAILASHSEFGFPFSRACHHLSTTSSFFPYGTFAFRYWSL
mmetsp:Transcript_17859/g.31068  ORF Transcript_17859/g.31068 Transcript_17859/m.31068 type:complete len:244 (-) Transcript_17859:32-763(-)